MPRDINHPSSHQYPPLFSGPWVIAAIGAAAIFAATLAFWAAGVVTRQAYNWVAVVTVPIFLFCFIAWIGRWRGLSWLAIWITFIGLSVLFGWIVLGEYQAAVTSALERFPI